MAKFRWKTEGSKPMMTVVWWPISAILLVVIAIAVLITMLVTGKVSDQEKDYQTKQAEYEKSHPR